MNDPRRQAVVLSVAMVVLLAILAHSALRKGGLFDSSRFNDFRAYHVAARAALDGDLVPAYDDAHKPYQYPPTLATLILPLGLLPYRGALVVWVLAMLLALAWSFRVADRVLCPPVKGLDKFFGFLFVLRMLQSDFANTNANTLVLAALLFAFAFERRGRPLAAGMTLALAASIKVAPLAILPWIIYRGRWRMLGGMLGGLVLWGVLVPGTVLGPSGFADAFAKWYSGLLAPMNPTVEAYTSSEAPGGYLPGQSPRVLLHRLARPIDASAHDDEFVHVNVVDVPKRAVDIAWIATSLAALVALLVFFRRRAPDRQKIPGRPAAPNARTIWGGAEIAVAIALMLLLSPLARKAHFVALFPLATYGFMLARVGPCALRKLSWALWAGALALVVLTSPGVLGDWLSTRALAFCPLSIATLMLVALTVVHGWRRGGCVEGESCCALEGASDG